MSRETDCRLCKTLDLIRSRPIHRAFRQVERRALHAVREVVDDRVAALSDPRPVPRGQLIVL